MKASVSPLFLLVGIWLNLAQAKLKRLGEHSAPSHGAAMLGGKFPPAGVFFNHFTKPGTPLLMKDVLKETRVPAFEMWTDEYLREKYGEEFVDVEVGKKEDRDGDNAPMQFSLFLDIYGERDLYMVHTMPVSMHDDMVVPYSLRCGGFQDNLVDVVMWFSSGNTSSVLHYDSMDNINCVLDGKKKMVLIDKKHKDQVEAMGWDRDRGFSYVDVDAVDPEEYPGVANTPWYQIHVNKGDCVFIPNRWYHHIYTPPGRSLAVNFWFPSLAWYNSSDCEGIERQNEPLKNFKLASPNMEVRSDFLSQFVDTKTVSKEIFLQNTWCSSMADAEKLWNILNKNKDKKLTMEELSSVNFDDLVQSFPQCFQNTKDGDGSDVGDDTVDTELDMKFPDVQTEGLIKESETQTEYEIKESEVSTEDELKEPEIQIMDGLKESSIDGKIKVENIQREDEIKFSEEVIAGKVLTDSLENVEEMNIENLADGAKPVDGVQDLDRSSGKEVIDESADAVFVRIDDTEAYSSIDERNDGFDEASDNVDIIDMTPDVSVTIESMGPDDAQRNGNGDEKLSDKVKTKPAGHDEF